MRPSTFGWMPPGTLAAACSTATWVRSPVFLSTVTQPAENSSSQLGRSLPAPFALYLTNEPSQPLSSSLATSTPLGLSSRTCASFSTVTSEQYDRRSTGGGGLSFLGCRRAPPRTASSPW